MSDVSPRRRLWVLVVDHERSSALVDGDGQLPRLVIELADGETTIGAVRRAVPVHLGLTGPVLDVLIDQAAAQTHGAGGVIGALVELPSPPAAWAIPPGLAWCPLADVTPTVDPNLSEHLERRLAELRGLVDEPDLRAAWSRPGWYEEAVAWIEQVLSESGRAPVREVLQVRHWGISAVMRVETGDGRFWFKASFPPFRTEAVVSAYLDRVMPGAVAGVVAAEPARGWLLLDDFGGDTLESEPAPNATAVEHLVAIQKAFANRSDELFAAGCEHRNLAALPAAFAAALATDVVRAWLVVEPARLEQIVAWLDDAVVQIHGLGIPDTLIHGDFHPGNVAICDGRPVLFDWSDAAVTNPLVDIAPWSTWFLDDDASIDALWGMFLRAWSDVAPLARLESLRPTLQGVAGAFHVVSYAALVAGLETCRRIESADGLTDFFGLLDAAVPAMP